MLARELEALLQIAAPHLGRQSSSYREAVDLEEVWQVHIVPGEQCGLLM